MFADNILKKLIIAVLAVLPIVMTAQVNTDQTLRIGQNALYFEDYMLSIQYFNQVISAKPYLAQPYFLRAIAKLNLEDYVGAEQDASKAIELNPFITDAWEVRGVSRQNLGNNRDAIGDYDHALALLPRNRQLLFNKAMAQSDIKDYEGADTTYQQLLKWYPAFDNGYLGRARLKLAQADTTAALEDINHALELNRNAFNGYIMRADIAINREQNYENALSDMNEAIKLQPKYVGLYINRAFLRYNTNDYFGAMADYDYALQLEPYNQIALFNRGLLLAEVNANDRALEDFTKVLSLDPDDYRSLYNRALIYRSKGNTSAALSDINRVIEAFPDFPGGYYIRSELYHDRNQLTAAERDYKKALALARAARPVSKDASGKTSNDLAESNDGDVPSELVSKRFATLLTIEDNSEIQEEYNNSAIRGKVQDRNINIEIEPMMQLSYYSSPTELQQNTYYIKEVDDLNATRALRFMVVVTNRIPNIDEESANRHFKSIEYYNSYIATHTPRPVDYIGRAMDFMTIRDYASVEKDVERAISLAPDNPLSYYLRAQARYYRYELEKLGSGDQTKSEKMDAITQASLQRKALDDILADFTKVVELSPRMAPAWFNKGNVLVEIGDYTSAIAAYTRAIELKSDLGEAYYNRGYVYLKLGNQSAGVADLSKAGELGILPAYNLIKRISK
jgi:tetratricopeptide (TPR) repeat protein